MKKFALCKNNRLANDQGEYEQFLLRVGEGREAIFSSVSLRSIKLPYQICTNHEVDITYLIRLIFETTLTGQIDPDSVTSRAILAPKNSVVDAINERAITLFPGGQEKVYLAADSVLESNLSTLYTGEFLNSLNPQGCPNSKLALKVGAPIILIRNINGSRGQCNGTRLIIRHLYNKMIDCEIISGLHKGSRIFLPRMAFTLDTSNTGLPFTLRRVQFPIKLAFSMTINRAQGQTLDRVGVFLKEGVFGHGQLYVALSRVRRMEHVKAMIPRGSGGAECYTENVVYKEIITN